MSSTDTAAVRAERPVSGGDGGHRLARGTLSVFDIVAATLANIAPALGFYFSFSLIAGAGGVGSPLVVVAAAVAIALVGNTLAQFARHHPSTGSFVTYIGLAFGPYAAIATALFLCVGYAIAFGAIVGISGGWTQVVLEKYLHVNLPWQLLTAVFTLGTLLLMVRGAKLSTKWAAIFFGAELLLLVAVAIALLVEHSGQISLHPFEPSHVSSLNGFGLAFPLAVYMFVGWENSAAMAEEAEDPRRSIAKAVLTSTAMMGAVYVLLTFATLIAYGEDIKRATTPSVPFIDAAEQVLGVFAILAYLAGVTSILGCLIGAANSQARIIFNSAREGLLPSWLGKVDPRHRTPVRSLSAYCLVTMAIVYVFGWSTDPFEFFGEVATLGTIPLSLVYLLTNVALPVYTRRRAIRAGALTHFVLPMLGVLAIGWPLYQLVKPGQPAPFSRYPYIALGLGVVALLYAAVLYRRDPRLGDRVGGIVADQD